MKRIIKLGVAAAAVAVASAAFAEEEEYKTEYGAVGWSPLAVGVVSPVQLPWGHCRWDVFGIDLGVLYYGAPKMYGVGVAGLGEFSRGPVAGIEAAGLLNWNKENVYALRVAAGANVSTGESTVYGIDVASFAYRQDFRGVDVQLLGSWQKRNWGAEVSGLFNYASVQSYGFNGALAFNKADVAYGCQLAIFNWANELHGAQLGIVNYCDDGVWGFQIGIINIMRSNRIWLLPIVNGHF